MIELSHFSNQKCNEMGAFFNAMVHCWTGYVAFGLKVRAYISPGTFSHVNPRLLRGGGWMWACQFYEKHILNRNFQWTNMKFKVHVKAKREGMVHYNGNFLCCLCEFFTLTNALDEREVKRQLFCVKFNSHSYALTSVMWAKQREALFWTCTSSVLKGLIVYYLHPFPILPSSYPTLNSHFNYY
jgi:hypothetical protein